MIFPPAPTTRCHGRPRAPRNAQTTCRARPGKPAARATSPYVATFPFGIVRMVSRMVLSKAGLLRAVPSQGAAQPLLERELRVVTEIAPRRRRIGLRISHVPFARCRILGR